MSEWQPIETAPKDGEPVLVFKPDERHVGSYICAAYWGEWSAFLDVTECWIACSGGPLSPPTHWMPLPPEPVSA